MSLTPRKATARPTARWTGLLACTGLLLLAGCSGLVSDLPADAGPTEDAGAPPDAGSGGDAGTDTDAGTGSDAGVGTDAGTASDAGTDAGSGTDAGAIADTTPPSTPTGLVVDALTASSGDLAWLASTDDVGVVGYDVSLDGGAATPVTGTAHVASGLAPATTYQARVRARDAAGNTSGWTLPLAFTTAPAGHAFASTFAGARTTQVWATARRVPPSITVSWATVTGRAVSAIAIDRKAFSASAWGTAVATPPASATEWTDTTVMPGVLYEYRVRLSVSTGTAYGYVLAGIDVEADDYRGRIALVVDASLEAQLQPELQSLQEDLLGDGWLPEVLSVARTATPSSVRSQLVTLRAASPDLRAAYLLGHVPVAYAGQNNPDGHSNRVMGSDGYYAELTSTWNGVGSCSTTPDQATLLESATSTNSFCNASFPSAVELEVGRVDMASLPIYAATEVQLLRAYLAKAHAFKRKEWAPQRRAYVKDRLGEAAALGTGLGAWASFVPLVGPTQVTVQNANSPEMFLALDGQRYLYSLGAYYGEGCTGSVGGVAGNISTVAPRAWGGVFNVSIGSYYGEFNCVNGFLRGLLASGDALTMGYTSQLWFFHPMAMGQHVGVVARLTMNNALSGTYLPGNAGIASNANTHLGLMGDPTLRDRYLAPPTAVVVSNAGGLARVAWQPSSELGLDGYHVYRVTPAGHVRLTPTPVTSLALTTATPWASGDRYVVRAVRTTTTPSGTLRVPSLGAIGRAP